MYRVKRFAQKMVSVVTKTMGLVLTWVTFLLFLPSMMFATYHLFWDFDLCKVFAAVIVVAVSVLLNKSL